MKTVYHVSVFSPDNSTPPAVESTTTTTIRAGVTKDTSDHGINFINSTIYIYMYFVEIWLSKFVERIVLSFKKKVKTFDAHLGRNG